MTWTNFFDASADGKCEVIAVSAGGQTIWSGMMAKGDTFVVDSNFTVGVDADGAAYLTYSNTFFPSGTYKLMVVLPVGVTGTVRSRAMTLGQGAFSGLVTNADADTGIALTNGATAGTVTPDPAQPTFTLPAYVMLQAQGAS